MFHFSLRPWPWMALAVSLASIFFYSPAQANFTYVFSGVGSGTLGLTPFTEVPFSITAQGDQTLAYSPSERIYRLDGVTAVLEIQGLGSASFLFFPTVAVNQTNDNSNPAVIISDPLQGRSIFSVGSSLVANYDLRSPLTIADGRAIYSSSLSFPTTRGEFNIESASAASFTAVPEPIAPVWWIIAIGAYYRRR